MRRNNKGDMTVIEQIESVKEQICDTRCKYAAVKKEKDNRIKEELEEACKKCPLNQL